MKFKLRTKIILHLLTAFILMMTIGGLGWYYIERLAFESEAILKDNYKSLNYAKIMFHEIGLIDRNKISEFYRIESDQKVKEYIRGSLSRFENALISEEGNITEPGELETVQKLRAAFDEYKDVILPDTAESEIDNRALIMKTSANYELIVECIDQIYEINQKRIEVNNRTAINTAETARTYILIGMVFQAVMILFFLIKIPAYITSPIYSLKNSFRQLSRKDYTVRMPVNKDDEFGDLNFTFNELVEKLGEYEKSTISELISEKAKIETIVDNFTDPVIGFDSSRNVVLVNREFEKLVNISRNEILNKKADEIAKLNDLMKNLMLSFTSDVKAQKENHIKIFQNNYERFYTKEFISFHEKDDKNGYIIILKDITKYLEQSSEKTNFISTVSHELKTPIASIQMSLKLLNDERVGALNEEQSKLTENIRKETQRLLNLSSSLLDVTRAEMGNIKLERKPIHPYELLLYAQETLVFQASLKNTEIEIRASEKLPKVKADVQKTLWVLVNLLSNAVRYSPANSRIILSASGYDGSVLFSVKDSGPGIDERYQQKIFDKFFQVPGASKHGTGLGLAIAKEFIIAQGGKIWVESKINHGSDFRFILPTDG